MKEIRNKLLSLSSNLATKAAFYLSKSALIPKGISMVLGPFYRIIITFTSYLEHPSSNQTNYTLILEGAFLSRCSVWNSKKKKEVHSLAVRHARFNMKEFAIIESQLKDFEIHYTLIGEPIKVPLSSLVSLKKKIVKILPDVLILIILFGLIILVLLQFSCRKPDRFSA